MKLQEKSCFMLQLFWLICAVKVKADVLTAHVGEDTVLPCIHSMANFIVVTWKGSFLNQSSCFQSYNGSITKGNCNNRIQLDINKNKISLRIRNCMVLDEGNYTCEIVNKTGTYIDTVALQVLAKPFVEIKTNENGYPECRAIGGNPAANISWSPEPTHKVVTWSNPEQNGTTTVISLYNSSNIINVTCTVSHPTFTNPMKKELLQSTPSTLGTNILTLTLGVVTAGLLFMLLVGILFWKRSNLRTCFCMKKNSPARQENPVFSHEYEEEVEPYASFTEKVNTIYSYSRDPTEYKGAQHTGERTYR
ncbi:cell surface glycoprotein CD200 receptor 2-like [Dendropsophus ebraccatus]|uniref:cell surface glycoprotein CD200 receptor 2-like n=1 Tax=Dendropsophus ebraccatus TaxID=150705 RepID=UPI003831761F